ncbi:hypothetical protein PSD17_66670 [Pseudonocardia sp. D17]|nr:hypothetical protein PSD17_66670 [Pseudonocardia sp. D17]
MTLLTRPGRESVVLYPEVSETDSDGNVRTRPSDTGVPSSATIQPLGSSDDDKDGAYASESRYRLRLPRNAPVLGAQSAVEWRGDRYAIVGDARVYNGSRRTAHVDYVISRG